MTVMSKKAPKYRVVLYVAGESFTGETAVANLKRIEEMFGEPIDIEVIDIETSPEAAEEAGIHISPTLVREKPQPVRRLIGDLSDTEKVIRFLKRE